jgi:hypothetical protein
VTSPRPAAPPDTGRMPSTRGGAQSNPLASPGGAGAQGAPTNPLPSPAGQPEVGAEEAAFVDAEGDPQGGAGSGGTHAAAAAVVERALEDARGQVQGLRAH